MTEVKKKTAAKKAPVAAPAKAVKAVKSGKKIKVTQVGSASGRIAKQKQTLIGLGLNKIRRTRVLEDSPEVRGMLNAVKHLVIFEEVA